ncbi:hypothetical protein [Winogradskyella haliclonae]|uniref:Uncharacterized protein n=1 Tax=Winogradskyella haliclonae TaxID=2048558 RepID=A0ABQ2BYB8_9FLAO|nr:hypothetical protein [Winogradskyella haliclonae]GGI57480.1 hypothetical protein GCM10011444_17890 [Winogradskyella haliclonae]
MKNVFQLVMLVLVLAQSIGFSQEATTVKIPLQDTKTIIDTEKFKDAVGSFLLEEANFELKIVQEGNKMFIVTEFSKDVLVQKNETTLREPTRGVDLELVDDNVNALKYSQNGYETLIKRVVIKN